MDWLGKSDNQTTQGTADWHQFRSHGIGSSEAATLMGVSPWLDLYTLWLDKTGQLPEEKKFKGNWAADRGTRLEPIAREKYESIVGAKFPAEVGVHSEYPFIRASYDGVNHAMRRMLEIKCPGKDAHQKALIGEIPAYYYPQVQWLMLVSGYNKLDYVSWDGESEAISVIPVNADKDYQDKLIEKAKWFWNLVETNTPPPTDETQINDQVLAALLDDRAKIKAEIDALTIGFEQTNAKIKEIAPNGGVCNGWRIKFGEVKGAIDYGKIPELETVDLEKYRKEPSRRLTISRIK